MSSGSGHTHGHGDDARRHDVGERGDHVHQRLHGTHAHDHDHGHDHAHGDHDHGGHDHGGHSHGAGGHNHHAHAGEKALFWVGLLTGGFMIAEAIGGLVSGSLALLADAGHMLADVAGLALAWFAFRVARWPSDHKRTYGFDRLQILVAFGNGLMLFVIAGFIVYEAIQRFMQPVQVLGSTMLWVAVLGLLVNIAGFLILHRSGGENLNMRGALLHVIGDLFGSVGAIAAAVIIQTTGWMPADPLMSILVAVIILRSAWAIVRDSAHILLEGAPLSVQPADIAKDLVGYVPGLDNVHHIHVWSITEEQPMMTLHACLRQGIDPDQAIRSIKARLRDRFGIGHATVEIEHETCADGDAALALAGH